MAAPAESPDQMRNRAPLAMDESFVVCRRQPWPIVDELVESLAPAGVRLQWITQDAPDAEVREAITTADALLGAWVRGWPFVREDFARAPRLRLVQLMSAGFDGLDLTAPISEGIPVANLGDANAGTVAEHVLMLALASLRRLPEQVALIRGGGWRPSPPLAELRGKTFGIVGVGNIGTEVARLVRAFGVRTIYTARHQLPADTEAALGLEYVTLPELLAASDLVSLNLALTPETRHIIGEDQLALMKPTSVLINTGRGGLVDQDALYRALTSGGIGFAALDVLEKEPPAADDPLLQLDNVIVTPHQGGLSPDAWPRIVQACWDNIVRALTGDDVLWRVP